MKRSNIFIGLLFGLLIISTTPVHAITLHATDDTDINLNTPNQNNGGTATIFVRNVGTGGVRHGLVRVDLGVLPSGITGAEIAKATLRLWVKDLDNEGSIDFHVVLNSWNEAAVTAATGPGISAAFATIAISNAQKEKFVTVDVTDLVQDWVDGLTANNGIAILPNAVNDIRLTLDSKENGATSHPMEIEVALIGPEGPQGPQGPQGITGAQGLQGNIGPIGPTGATGATGATGPQGPAGPQGATGATGAQGPQGVQGETGPTGATGPQGPQGLTGATGATGAQGPQGSIGPQGPAGSANIAGTTNSIVKFTGATSGGDSQIFDDGTNVGVGTTIPGAKLDVAGVVNTSTQYNIGGSRVVSAPGSQNMFVGVAAGQSNTTGVLNTALGDSALFSNTGGNNNTATGVQALFSNTTGFQNTATGVSALNANTTGSTNTATGVQALATNTTGNSNTATGANALLFNTTGSGNTASGTSALQGNTTGTENTAIGSNAMVASISGLRNTAVGYDALRNGGSSNTALGYRALMINTTNNNTAVGAQALAANTNGANNTAVGEGALLANIGGANNIAIGGAALQANTHGASNTALGLNALGNNNTGSQNTATGQNALVLNKGNRNTATGVQALQNTSTADDNTAVGHRALFNNTTGIQNTAIGVGADVATANLVNATAIGFGAIVDNSDKIRLGNASVTVIEAQVGITVVSDKTKKENFQPVDGEDVLKKLRDLSLTSWNFIGHDAERFRHYGPMAQDFFAAFGHDGVGTIGTPPTINSGDMAGILMIAVQALEKRTQELKAKDSRILALEKETAELRAKQSYFETVAVRLDALDLKLNQPVRVKAETTSSDETARLDR